MAETARRLCRMPVPDRLNLDGLPFVCLLDCTHRYECRIARYYPVERGRRRLVKSSSWSSGDPRSQSFTLASSAQAWPAPQSIKKLHRLCDARPLHWNWLQSQHSEWLYRVHEAFLPMRQVAVPTPLEVRLAKITTWLNVRNFNNHHRVKYATLAMCPQSHYGYIKRTITSCNTGAESQGAAGSRHLAARTTVKGTS